MTETARLADYVLPAASQYEKPEATFFNLEFPRNTFHLRHPLLEPLPGHAARARDLGAARARARRRRRRRSSSRCAPPRARAAQAYAQALDGGDDRATRRSRGVLPYVLYETLGPTLPEGLQGAAALWGLAQRCAMTYPDAVRRAGHADGDALFDAILDGPLRDHVHASTSTRTTSATSPIPTSGSRSRSRSCSRSCARCATRSRASRATSSRSSSSVGERRSYTANDIFRDPGWRKRDADGALRVSAEDAARLGLDDGGRARVTTARGSAEATVEVSDAMLAGHASLPNGYGLDFTDADGRDARRGRRAERAHVVGLARPVRRHAVAQARAGADRAGRRLKTRRLSFAHGSEGPSSRRRRAGRDRGGGDSGRRAAGSRRRPAGEPLLQPR